MSHAVEYKTNLKDIGIVQAAFKEHGWTIKANAKIRTYDRDPAGDKIFPFVAVNPDEAYDIGLEVSGDAWTMQADWSMANIERKLGPQCGLVKQTYNKIVYERYAKAKGGRITYKTLENGVVRATMVIEVNA